MPSRAKSGVADDRTWTLSGEGAALPDGRPVIVTAVEGPWLPYGERVQVVPAARLEQAQAKARESDAKIDVLCEAAARLRVVARRAVTEDGEAVDQARRELREGIDWLVRGGVDPRP